MYCHHTVYSSNNSPTVMVVVYAGDRKKRYNKIKCARLIALHKRKKTQRVNYSYSIFELYNPRLTIQRGEYNTSNTSFTQHISGFQHISSSYLFFCMLHFGHLAPFIHVIQITFSLLDRKEFFSNSTKFESCKLTLGW